LRAKPFHVTVFCCLKNRLTPKFKTFVFHSADFFASAIIFYQCNNFLPVQYFFTAAVALSKFGQLVFLQINVCRCLILADSDKLSFSHFP
jgi:hypothetical protein